MVDIRPKDLPAAGAVSNAAALVIDNGVNVEKSTPLQIVDAAVPLASQAVAEAGTDNATRVSPLRVSQYISSQLGGSSLPASFLNKAQAAAVGVSGSATNLGAFTGTIIPDDQTAKQALQALETATEARILAADAASTDADKGPSLIGYDQSQGYQIGTVGHALKRFLIASEAPYNILMDGTDETEKWQNLLSDITPGSIVILASGISRISSTLYLGDGSDSTRSALNSVTFICPMVSHVVAFIDAGSGIQKSGTILEWHGEANGTMMEWRGPIHGIKVVGGFQFDGRNLAGYGLRAYSFSYCDIDAISAYKCTICNIDLDTRNATSIGGDANGLTSALNRIGQINSFCHETTGAIALRMDGYEVTGGQDVTVTKIELCMLGYSANRGKGLWLGYTDFVGFGRLITIPYGTEVGGGDVDPALRPAAMYLDGSSNPFDAPTTVSFDWFAANGGGKIVGGTAGQVYIENFSMDEGGALPNGVSGLNIRRIHSNNVAYNGQNRGTWQQQIITAIADGQGLFLRDGNNDFAGSVTRSGARMALNAPGGINVEKPLRPPVYTYAELIALGFITQGDRAFCSNSNTVTPFAQITGSGSNAVPAYYDGSVWRAG